MGELYFGYIRDIYVSDKNRNLSQCTNAYLGNTKIYQYDPMSSLLIDFKYTKNGNIYNITEWKETLNGVYNSSHMFIPNNSSITSYLDYKSYSARNIIISDLVKIPGNSLYDAFSGQSTLQSITFPNSVTNISNMCSSCRSLTTAVCGANVTNMVNAYSYCNKLKTAVCGAKVTNMVNAYYMCNNLTTAVCGAKVTNMVNAYYSCNNLTTAACGASVTNMSYAYYRCNNLTTAVCGASVTDMSYAYAWCNKLKTAVCGAKVTNMYYAYQMCKNLTTAACGASVTNMAYAYYNCINLTTAVFGNNVTDIRSVYERCTNIRGNVYLYSNNINSVYRCFYGRNTSNRLNIYVRNGSTTKSSFIANRASTSITGLTVRWTHNSSNKCYYNTTQNLYIYYTL